MAEGPATTEIEPTHEPDDGRGRRGRDRGRPPIVRVGDRVATDTSRTSPRMRFDVLQLAAWLVGLTLVVAGLVAFARTGFADVGPFAPAVEVGGQPATPLFAAVWLLIGTIVLVAGTGTVAEQRLRIGGVLLAVAGLVLLVEPTAFVELLGVDGDSGTLPIAFGTLLTVASFVPPLSIARPGIRADGH